jgi:hypothetical protein
MVAVGLMAILLTMIAVIFYEATQAFRVARASIEIHESARSALNALVNDLTAAEFTSYDNGVQGYFALSAGPADPALGSSPPVWNNAATYAVNSRVISGGVVNNGVISGGNEYICITANLNQQPPNANWQLLGPWIVPVAVTGAPIAVDTLTFTTLAPQPGARDATPEAVEQLALVRYALEWDGGYATIPGSAAPQPTYNLVKRVRFPCTNDPNLNMDQFAWAVIGPNGQPVLPYQYLLPLEYTFHTSPPLASNDPDVILDEAGLRYAQSEVIAFHVLSMNVRLFCLPLKNLSAETSEAFVEAGFASAPGGATPPTFTDTTKNWLQPWQLPIATQTLRIYAGTGASQYAMIQSNTANVITLNATAPTLSATGGTWAPLPDTTSQYRIDGLLSSLFPAPASPPPPSTPPPPPPGWYQRVSAAGSYNFLGTTYRPPAVVELTLQTTDLRATRAFTFTQRFYIPASER